MKLYYVANVRMPTEKAHGIQLAKTVESFVSAGVDVELVLPNRKRASETVEKYYRLHQNIKVTYIPVLDLYSSGRLLFALSSLTFMVGYWLYLTRKVVRGEDFILYTVDSDTFASSFLGYIRRPFFSELHGARRSNMVTRSFFKRARGIIAINTFVRDGAVRTFSFPHEKILVEPNGVDVSLFSSLPTISEARIKLSMRERGHVALYVGRLYGWKYLDILAEAARHAPEINFYMVGGTKEEYQTLTGIHDVPVNLTFYGSKAPHEIPLWLAAADTLLVLGSNKDIDSARHTSPMKAFEYMASGRPIVSSATPALKNILDESSAFFYEPDSSSDLVRAVREAMGDGGGVRAQSAHALAEVHSWDRRAERILTFIVRYTTDELTHKTT